MLKTFLAHHADRAMRGVKYNAIKHCHARGLDSIMLHDEPGNRIRMFIAQHNHELHLNRSPAMTLAVHSHHCDVRFVNVYGDAQNDRFRVMLDPMGNFHEMDYKSAIITGTGSLTPTGARGVMIEVGYEPLANNPVMRANEMHTIWAAPGPCAWLVIEGVEDGDYDSRCWTRNTKPVDFTRLYHSMTQAEVAARLQAAAQCAN